MSEAQKPALDPQVLAEACATNPLAYEGFVLNLASPPASYNLGSLAVVGLIEALERLNVASLELDHFKRVITYGEKQRINPATRLSGVSAEQMAIMDNEFGFAPAGPEGRLTDEQVKRRLLIHGLLGKLTEAIELAPILISLLTIGKCDEVNLREELGDDDFYTVLTMFSLGIDQRHVRHANVMKLSKRYKGGVFSVEEAIRRQLDEERTELEQSIADRQAGEPS